MMVAKTYVLHFLDSKFHGLCVPESKGPWRILRKYTLAFRNTGSCGPCNNCPNYDFSYIPISNYLTHASSISPNGCKMYRFEVVSGIPTISKPVAAMELPLILIPT
jgi:hypothetical protein